MKRETISEFLLTLLGLSDKENQIRGAANRAYHDFCRTLRFGDITDKERKKFRDDVLNVINRSIESLDADSQEKYDEWHNKLCLRIIAYYNEYKVEFNYGQAQKWVNMTMKYLLVLHHHKAVNVEEFLHAPVDRITLDGLKYENDSWSSYEYGEYIDIQKHIRNSIQKSEKYKSVIEWEFDNWNKHKNLDAE